MTTNHLQTIKTLLDAESGLSAATIKASSYDEADTAPVISCVEVGGDGMPYLGIDVADHTQMVTVTVRAEGRKEARELMRVVDGALTGRQPAGYTRVSKRSGPRYAGVDDDGLHKQTVDVTCQITE